MNVVVLIGGREAIPVRAIPWLTNWRVMVPNEIVAALAHKDDEDHEGFYELSAHHRQDGAVTPVDNDCWRNLCQKLKVLDDQIDATELSPEDGHQRWRDKSLLLLPAGVFVWKDEYVMCYEKCYDPHDSFEEYNDGSYEEYSTRSTTEEESAFDLTLNFNPFISENETAMVLEGFEPQQTKSSTTMTDAILHRLTPLPVETPALATGGVVAVTDASAATVASVAVIEATVAPPDATVVDVSASKPAASGTVTHSTKAPRRYNLTPVIELAQSKCRNPTDTAEVWAQLQVLAENKTAPLIGATDDGLQYLNKGIAAIFKRDALNKRLHPKKRGKPGKRR